MPLHRRLTVAAAAALALPVGTAALATPVFAQQAQEPAVQIVPQPATTLPLKHTPQPTTAAITPADLMTRLYIFADDSMQGREAGTIGNVKGTDYIASQVKAMGLVPAGDNGTYFQTIPLKVRTVSPSSTLTSGGMSLAFGTDWVGSSTHSINVTDAPVIFGGSLGDTASTLADSAGKGKIVVFYVPPGTSPRATRGAQRIAHGAVAVALVGIEQYMPFFTRPQTFVDDPSVMPPNANQSPATIILSNAMGQHLGDLTKVAPGTQLGTASLDLQVSVTPTPYPARNVVAILPGSDPKLKGEYVAIGAHNDHIGFNNRPVDHDSLRIFNHIVRPGGAEQGGKQATPAEQAEVNQQLAVWRTQHPNSQRADSISNGADDDGSGSVSVLEIAQKLASLKPAPKRSILFVWHVGEEKGLLGSEYFTEHPTVTRDSIVAQLNMDMVGRGDAWDVTGETKEGAPLHGNPNYLQLVGSRRLSTELGNLIEKVNKDDHHDLALDYSMDANGHPMNIYCRSDHYEYARWNIPVTFFTTGGHSDYHQVTDEPEYIDYQHMAKVDNFVEDVAVHVANMDHRPIVDGAKMDPHGSCKQ